MNYPTDSATQSASLSSITTKAASPAITSRFQEREAKERAYLAERSMNESPEAMPEIERELTMLLGALDGLEAVAASLAATLSPVRREVPVAQYGTLPKDAQPATSQIGRRIRAAYDQVAELERQLGNVRSELAL